MSVIQQIQEKYAKLMAVIIAVALLTFVVMLAFENGGSLFRGTNSNSVGSVNGKSISYTEFQNTIKQVEANMKQQGYPAATAAQEAPEAAWNQEVYRTIVYSEIDKLGMQITKAEIGDILYGANPPQDLKQNFTDPKTGLYDAQAAKQAVDQTLNSTDPEKRAGLNSYIQSLEDNRLQEKYNSLFSGSINVPKWMVEKENADNSQIAKISLVREFYTTNSIPDSTIKITDAEINDYVSKHKKDPQLKQEESRSISYVAFPVVPSASDSADAKSQIESLKPTFDTTHDVANFISANASDIDYADIYTPKSVMQMPNKDSIQSLPIGAVAGPYLDNNAWVMAKMVDIKQLPDSIRCRHILISTQTPDSIAKIRIDSIEKAIQGGANFDTLETRFSDDKGAHQTKGVMTFSSVTAQTPSQFAPEFGQFIVFGQPGQKKVLKTQFGWHYIEILKFINVEPHYKVGYLSRTIEASKATDDNAASEANAFAVNSRDLKSFDTNAEKLKTQGHTKSFATDITRTGNQIMGLGSSRSLVKAIYEADLGDIIGPMTVGNNHVVAVVTEVNKEGIKTASKARLMVEPILRNRKKGELLKQKIGKVTTLEAAAAALGGKAIETVDSLRIAGGASLVSNEPKVIGAAFNPANRGKVVPEVLIGNSAVFVVRVDYVGTTPLADANVVEQRKARIEQARANPSNPFQALRQAAVVKDKRDRFF